jgi:hypothetical protein
VESNDKVKKTAEFQWLGHLCPVEPMERAESENFSELLPDSTNGYASKKEFKPRKRTLVSV